LRGSGREERADAVAIIRHASDARDEELACLLLIFRARGFADFFALVAVRNPPDPTALEESSVTTHSQKEGVKRKKSPVAKP
jgi:hypothetical protein